jgi:hypothetical protein
VASIEKRPDGRYRALWREYPSGPQKTRQFARKGDADRFLDGLRGDLARGVYVDPSGGRTLFVDYAEKWRAGQVHRPNTATQAETYLRLHAYPTLGRRPIGAIRRSEIQASVREQSTTLAPGSVELVYRWVATIFKSAVADRLIASSPCIRITLPKRADTEIVPLNVTEVEALAAAVPDRYRACTGHIKEAGFNQGFEFLVLEGPEHTGRNGDRVLPPEDRRDFEWGRTYAAPQHRPFGPHARRNLDRYADRDKGWLDNNDSLLSVLYWLVETCIAASLSCSRQWYARPGRCSSRPREPSFTSCRLLSGPRSTAPGGSIAVAYPVPRDIRSGLIAAIAPRSLERIVQRGH